MSAGVRMVGGLFWTLMRVNVNYKGTTFGINYNENWVYSLSGNTLTIVSATGNPNLLQEPRVGYKYTKQQ